MYILVLKPCVVTRFALQMKRDDKEEDSLVASFLDVGIYTPFFKEDEDSPITELSHVTGILARLNDGVHINNEAIVNFIAEY
jgi:hypothetical protein